MIDRKEGWYHVKYAGEWECAQFQAPNEWLTDGVCFRSDDHFDEIGARIPSPDEPWQVVPKILNDDMIEEFETALTEQGWSSDAAGEIDKQDLWHAQLNVAPSPDDSQ